MFNSLNLINYKYFIFIFTIYSIGYQKLKIFNLKYIYFINYFIDIQIKLKYLI